MTEVVVLDASAMVTMLLGGAAAKPIVQRLRGTSIHVPGHFDAEVLSAVGRLHRAQAIDEATATRSLESLAQAPFERHALATLLMPAWGRRGNVRLVDALYVALATELGAPVITLDRGLAAAASHADTPRA